MAIMLAQVISSDPDQPSQGDFFPASHIQASHEMMPGIAAVTSTETSPVMVVNHDRGFDPKAMIYDGVHPNLLGETHMANAWFDALQESGLLNTVLVGDFEQNGSLAAADIDLLSEAIAAGNNNPVFDLQPDGVVDADDLRVWVEEVFGSYFGDADLNKSVDFADFLSLSASFGKSAGWENGDFDGNGIAEFADVLLLPSEFGQTATASHIVPEPSASPLIWLLLSLVYYRAVTNR